MTQKTFWGQDERVCSHKDILANVARMMPDDIPEDRWRSVVMWIALLQYPAVLELFKIATELKRLAPSESLWIEMLEKKLRQSAVSEDLPNFESLTRALREIQDRYWKRIEAYKYDAISKTI